MDNKWFFITIIVVIIVILCILGFFIFSNHKKQMSENHIDKYIPNEVNVNSNDINIPEENLDINRSDENVTIKILNGTATRESVEILITDKNKNHFHWGEDFRVQKKINGDWKELQYVSDDLIFNAIIHKLDENNQLKMKVDYGKYYGTLENGIYRIVKTVYNNKEIDLYSNEFEIK